MEAICSLVTDGTHDSPKLQPSGVPFIKGKHISQGFVDFANCDFISEADHAEACRRVRPMAGDVLFSNIGSVGDTARVAVNRDFSIKNVALFRPDSAKVDPRYFYYLVANPRFKESMLNLRSGSAQPFITLGSLRGYETNYHTERAQQRRIARILSTYDDLIENNTRRIATLEEMARRIYEEWFVRFHFPDYEGVRMVESELGLVPLGWESRPLGAVLAHHIGGGWGQEAASDEFSVPAHVIRGTDIPDVRMGSLGRSPLRFHTPSNLRSRRLEARDIVFEVSGGSKDQPVGRAVMLGDALLARADSPVICASFCRLVRTDASQILPELLRFHFDRIYANREIMKYQTQSTGITNFKFAVFLEKEVVLKPPSKVQDQFARVARPILQLAENLGIKNDILRATRDLLLPKLISGELDVSAMPEPDALAA